MKISPFWPSESQCPGLSMEPRILPVCDVDVHDAPRQCIVGQVLLIVSVSDDPQLVVGRDVHALGSPEMGPLAEELAIGIEDLDAIVLAVADIDILVGIDAHDMGGVELTRVRCRACPIP